MATIQVSPEPDKGRTIIQVDDPPEPLVVERDDGAGWQQRRYAPLTHTPGSLWVAADYECPTDVLLRYRVQSAPTVTTSTTLDSRGQTWWKPLPYPNLALPVQVDTYLPEAESVSETVDMWPIGAAYPITVAGARRAFRGEVTLATLNRQDETRFITGMRQAPVVLFQPPGGLLDQVYLSVTTVVRVRPRLLAEPVRQWRCTVQVRQAPAVEWTYPAGAQWQDYDTERTWAQWRQQSWLGVLLGDA